jgi:hypothetical protein
MLGLALGLWVAGLPVAGPALAARLDKEACEALKAEQASLVGAGVRDQMAKGPEWAKANLSRDKISGIQRLIEVEEQLAFRCERPRPAVAAAPAVNEGEEPAAAGAKAAKGQKAAAPEAAAAPAEVAPAAKAKSKKARKPKAEDAEAAAPAPAPVAPAAKDEAPATAPATPAAKKKAAKKPADDAFVAPPKPAAQAGVGDAGSGEAATAKAQR